MSWCAMTNALAKQRKNFTEGQKASMRNLYESGKTLSEIAGIYLTSTPTVSKIVRASGAVLRSKRRDAIQLRLDHPELSEHMIALQIRSSAAYVRQVFYETGLLQQTEDAA